MANFKGVIKCTEEQYNTLKNGGSIVVGGVTLTYDPDILYVTGSADVETVDIGNGQTTINGIVYPTIPVATAQEIYAKVSAGVVVKCHWSLVLPYDFLIIGHNENKLVAVVHGKVIMYEWTDGSTANITPSILEEYMHSISISETTAAGSWDYQFAFKNDVPTAYTQLSAIGHYLYTNHRDIVLPATGLCVHNSEKYFITDVKAEEDNKVTVGMYKVADGTRNTISTGVINVTDYVL